MTLWQTSLTYQIWVWLCDVYEDSTLHRFLAAAGRWCSGQIEESRILRPLCWGGIVARSWKDSLPVPGAQRPGEPAGDAASRLVQGVEPDL